MTNSDLIAVASALFALGSALFALWSAKGIRYQNEISQQSERLRVLEGFEVVARRFEGPNPRIDERDVVDLNHWTRLSDFYFDDPIQRQLLAISQKAATLLQTIERWKSEVLESEAFNRQAARRHELELELKDDCAKVREDMKQKLRVSRHSFE